MSEPLVLSDDQEAALSAMLSDSWRWGALFITGPAGTGKSTVLKAFRERSEGNVVVVAPTGIAALNCGGQTIHRTFRFPPRFIRYRNDEDIRVLKGQPRSLLRKLDTLIIDEISMVRADVMDAIDWSLRVNLEEPNLPFGGKRVIVVGDVMQLPPVIRPEDAPLLKRHWAGGYFFDANVWRLSPLAVIELQTVHRQKGDAALADALRALRNGDVAGIEVLNERHTEPANGDQVLHLTPRRDESDRINSSELGRLTEVGKSYPASIDGQFPESDMPTEAILNLKIGAQVMLVANGDGYANGTLAKVSAMGDETVTVESRAGKKFVLGRTSWERVEFQLDSVTRRIEPHVVATFRQFPIRLAWATTIHKAQGLTLESAHIDVGRGFFSHGQAYVALSRVRDAASLTLSQPISPQNMRWDRRILEFRRLTEEEGFWSGSEWEPPEEF